MLTDRIYKLINVTIATKCLLASIMKMLPSSMAIWKRILKNNSVKDLFSVLIFIIFKSNFIRLLTLML